jgi:hypothetical protein
VAVIESSVQHMTNRKRPIRSSVDMIAVGSRKLREHKSLCFWRRIHRVREA